MRRRKFVRVLVVIVALAALAAAIDQVSLAIWKWRIIHFHHALLIDSQAQSSGRIPDVFKVFVVNRQPDGAVSAINLGLEGPKPTELWMGGGNNPSLTFIYHPPRVCFTQYPPFRQFPAFAKIYFVVAHSWPKPTRGDVLVELTMPQ